MLGQRVSNEQSNVGPTKYVAVGPTLNQRLGFGWRMVSVLAGKHAPTMTHRHGSTKDNVAHTAAVGRKARSTTCRESLEKQ